MSLHQRVAAFSYSRWTRLIYSRSSWAEKAKVVVSWQHSFSYSWIR